MERAGTMPFYQDFQAENGRIPDSVLVLAWPLVLYVQSVLIIECFIYCIFRVIEYFICNGNARACPAAAVTAQRDGACPASTARMLKLSNSCCSPHHERFHAIILAETLRVQCPARVKPPWFTGFTQQNATAVNELAMAANPEPVATVGGRASCLRGPSVNDQRTGETGSQHISA